MTLFIIMCSSIILYATKGIFSDTYITNDIRNSEDIYFPRQDKDGILDNRRLKDIYGKKIIEKTNIPINAKQGTHLIFNTNENTTVWNDNTFTKVISSNLSPSQERMFNVGDHVNIFAIVKSYQVVCKDQFNYIDGAIIKTSDVKPEEKAIYINIISDKELRALTAKDKLTFKNNMVTLQEIDVRLRKSLMGDSKIKLYEYGSLYIKGFWDIHYKDGTTRHTNLFSYPDYTDNEIIDVGKVSHFDVYLNKDILYE
ncbi:TPA: exotoxin OB-fold domain-containing protein [Streptococcus pyogenes]|uniref:exotoxin beta-grasp domain-containing protein n=1 Tax=Streptococcus pyogenes TaxID=1314 RepID=UPI0010EDA561|nr:exotoxin OB-fold domain-containing protein [Streptococcus pyogenes]VGX49005.1 exotoxin type C precursor [Streptococcus pyogenes]VHE84500.1 exotoxin type C precursor [Streptococcus pyogenes]